jgi:hemolysin activation/secretion protein
MRALVRASVRAGLFIAISTGKAHAQPISDAELTRRQAQQQEQARKSADDAPDVFTPAPAVVPRATQMPPESPCFTIDQVEWRGAERLPWIITEQRTVIGRCIGVEGLRAFQDHLTQRLITKGYITSRVLFPEQNLASGRLTVHVIAGTVGEIREQGGAIGMHRMALPGAKGAMLNQRDLDQALENIRRLGGQQAVAFDLMPGADPGQTDILIHHPEASRWRGLLTLDDSGADSTGRMQIGGVLSIDSPLHLYDALTVMFNSNANVGDNKKGTRSAAIDWNMPFGYASVLLGASHSRYRQTVAGFGHDIVYSGRSHAGHIGAGYVAYRTPSARGTFRFTLSRKISRSFIDDVEIDVQFRDVVGYDAGFTHRQYFGAATLDLGAGIRGSLPARSRAPGLIIGTPNWDGRYRIITAQAGLTAPWKLAGQHFRYHGSLRLQHAATLLPAMEYFSIGNRYSVRGFDGASSLAAEHGWSLRNDFTWLIGGHTHQLFLGLDAGAVSGPNADTLLGKSLAGIVLGARGDINRFSYELTIGRPLHKPAGFHAKQPAVTVALSAAF